ncbi:MAG TPA: NAD/NADP octopine/nopaline dehydrogenase family protein, partial [Gemmataceae bacterium]|nr:NAD/NADP octopine/nopaline dehydrogenase family protein [Gemmataceae bacterium]
MVTALERGGSADRLASCNCNALTHRGVRAFTTIRRTFVAVLGAGHGGMALAAYLARNGHHVHLWNRSQARVDPVASLGGVRLTLPGAASTIQPIVLATSNLAAAVSGAKVILVAVPASGHAEVARACAPYLRGGQTVLLLPGRTGGALEFRRVLQDSGCRAEIVLGEANTFPLASRTIGPAEAVVFGDKAELTAAALPARDTGRLIASCRDVLPMLTAAPSVLHTSLSNLGAILHPTILLLNAGRIERGEVFDFYTDGVTSRVAQVLTAADAERLRIASAHGERVQSLQEWIAAAYGHQGDTLQDAVAGNPSYVGIKAPTTLQHRYLHEDVPTGLVPLIELASAAGLAVPTLRSLVTLAEFTLQRSDWPGERSLATLGLDCMSIAEIRRVVASGFASQVRRSGSR